MGAFFSHNSFQKREIHEGGYSLESYAVEVVVLHFVRNDKPRF
jgi:hypothetical protein